MKILPAPLQPTLAAETVENKTEKAAPAQNQKAAAKPPRTSDHIDFSASLSAGLQTQQDLQAKRVESIKSRLASGTYQVGSRDVAEKMLAGSFEL